MEEIKVSVIVPIYNAEKYLSRTIEYLKNQTLKEIEIILVDDGSTDSSPAICDEACQSDKRIRCIHKQNAGVSAARNDGIKAAQGEYLMFCDADDVPAPQMAEKLLFCAQVEHSDVVLCGFKRQTGESIIDCSLPYSVSIGKREEIIHKMIMPMIVWSYAPDGIALPDIYGSVWRGIYRKSFILSHAIRFPLTISLGEDMVFNLLVDISTGKIAFVNENLYTYVENINSATHSNGIKIWEKYLETWKMVHRLIMVNRFKDREINWHNYQLSRYAISAIVEGVCPLNASLKQKQMIVKGILNNSNLADSLKFLPKNISYKNKIICFAMKNKMYRLLTVYYQHVCNRIK